MRCCWQVPPKLQAAGAVGRGRAAAACCRVCAVCQIAARQLAVAAEELELAQQPHDVVKRLGGGGARREAGEAGAWGRDWGWGSGCGGGGSGCVLRGPPGFDLALGRLWVPVRPRPLSLSPDTT